MMKRPVSGNKVKYRKALIKSLNKRKYYEKVLACSGCKTKKKIAIEISVADRQLLVRAVDLRNL
jgi:hypothetical protein